MAERPCRTCKISYDELGCHVSKESVSLRNEQEYLDRCDVLDHLKRASAGTRRFWSKECGITRSVLASLPVFDVTKCILHDPMHVL